MTFGVRLQNCIGKALANLLENFWTDIMNKITSLGRRRLLTLGTGGEEALDRWKASLAKSAGHPQPRRFNAFALSPPARRMRRKFGPLTKIVKKAGNGINSAGSAVSSGVNSAGKATTGALNVSLLPRNNCA